MGFMVRRIKSVKEGVRAGVALHRGAISTRLLTFKTEQC